MAVHEFFAQLDIRVSCEAGSPQEALAKAINDKSYEIVGSRLADARPTVYISTAEYAKRTGHKSYTYITKLCASGAIPGAIKIGRSYAIPEDTPYIDRRVSDGKYTGKYDLYGRKRYEEAKARKAAGLPDPPKRPPNDNPIARARTALGMQQADLAKAVGCHVQTISSWENGFRNPSKASLQRLAEALGVSPESLKTDK